MPFRTLREDYVRHGRQLGNPAFVALATYRFGRWAIERRNPAARWLACKAYGFVNLFVANVTKVWIPPQVTIGADFHIIHAEGSLSIHPDVVIGDRCGVMHNVTLGTNMGAGAPRIASTGLSMTARMAGYSIASNVTTIPAAILKTTPFIGTAYGISPTK